jgi:hypothetical protein
MNLEILWVVYGLTGNTTLRDIALAHADTTMKNHIRTDGSFILLHSTTCHSRFQVRPGMSWNTTLPLVP